MLQTAMALILPFLLWLHRSRQMVHPLVRVTPLVLPLAAPMGRTLLPLVLTLEVLLTRLTTLLWL